MRQKKLLLTCVLGLLLLSGRDANAFWKYIYELSGPGPFVGMDFVFPWSLSSYNGLTNAGINHNREYLLRRGIEVPLLETNAVNIRTNPAHCAWLERVLTLGGKICTTSNTKRYSAGVSEFDVTVDIDALDRLIELTPDKTFRTELLEKKAGTLTTTVLVPVSRLDAAATAEVKRDLARSLRRFGAGPGGVFGSKATLPVIRCDVTKDEECRDQSTNWFFNLTLGLAFSQDNKLDYAPEFDRDKDVVWLTMYPNWEKRVRIRNSKRYNVFGNVGVTVNRFLGAGFEDFTVVSGRARGGVRAVPRWLLPISFGVELDWYPRAFRPEDFGARPDDSDADHFGWALFVSVELTRDVR